MQLSYRGCQYKKQSIVLENSNIDPINAKYRGINYVVGAGQPQIYHSSILLKYRGISYQGVNNVNDVKHHKSDNLYLNVWSI